MQSMAAIGHEWRHVQLLLYRPRSKKEMMEHLGFILFYLFAIVVLILHFNGTLEEYNLEWLLLVLAVAVFPAVIYL